MTPRRFLRRAHRRGVLVGEEKTRFARATCGAIERQWYKERLASRRLPLCAYRNHDEEERPESGERIYELHVLGGADEVRDFWWWVCWVDTTYVDGRRGVADWAQHMNEMVRDDVVALMIVASVLDE